MSQSGTGSAANYSRIRLGAPRPDRGSCGQIRGLCLRTRREDQELTPEQLTEGLKRLASANIEAEGAEFELDRQAMRAAIRAAATCLDGTVMPPWM